MLLNGMAFWLVKTEPDVYSIDDLARDQATGWNGVRNYQARNYLKAMQDGDLVLVYHSMSEPSGVAGVARVQRTAYADPTQFDKKSEFFDPAAKKDEPRWFCPDLAFVEKFSRFVPVGELRAVTKLKDMVLLQRGSRLSVQPVTKLQFDSVCKLAEEGKGA